MDEINARWRNLNFGPTDEERMAMCKFSEWQFTVFSSVETLIGDTLEKRSRLISRIPAEYRPTAVDEAALERKIQELAYLITGPRARSPATPS